MQERNRRRWAIWLRVGFVVALAIAAHVINAVSASAAIPAVAAGSADAAASPRIVLAGFTSQQYPVFFKIAGDARKLTLAGIALNMTCTSGNQFVLEDAFGHVRIDAGGKMHSTTTAPPTAGANGATFTFTDSLTARIGPRNTQVSGVWRLIVHYTFTDGSSDQCDSGPVRFLATS